jgi:DNA (cytosine-5)-methyltransferase 1
VDNPKIITHLSLCSGYEGIGLGLRKVFPFLREIAFVEREGFAVANLVAKMEAGLLDTAPIHTDLKTFPYRVFLNKVDILSGGFPCQPFSQAGLKKSTEDPRHLFPYIEKGIKQCRPAIVFLENVEGILSSTTGDGQPVLQYVLRRLEALGYRSTAGIFSASEAGAPHQRKRVFILGMAHSEDIGRRGREDTDGDNPEWLQEQAGEKQSNLRGETEGCGGDSRGKELGDTTSDGCYEGKLGEDSRAACQGEVKRGDGEAGQEEGRLQEPTGGCSQLAYSSSEGLESDSRDFNGPAIDNRDSTRHERGIAPDCLSGRWPARPGQPQFEWEEPRVVESNLGGKPNGYSQRVDRLRLLGNGCVPQTVEIAFLTLIERLK